MIAGDPATYGLFGTRLDATFDLFSAHASGQLGAAVAGAEGRWLRGDVSVASGRRLGAMAVRGTATAFGLHYVDPFAYDAAGLDLRPALSAGAGPFILTARPLLTVGRWSTERDEGNLGVAGGDMGVERSFGPLATSLSVGALSVVNGVTAGAFIRTGAQAAYTRGRWSGAVRLDGQRTPLEAEIGGGVALTATLRPGVQLHVHAGRTLRDPLFGTEGTVALSTGVAFRPIRWSPPPPAPVAAVGEASNGGRRVVFVLRAPEAGEVALAGDFSGWAPLPMERTSEGWRIERVLPPGLHHFGFIVDGEWALPPDAPGVVDDGWGQRNASIVVEP